MAEKQEEIEEIARPILKTSAGSNKPTCKHCGEICDTKIIQSKDLNFCCDGCKSVYEILQENDLCSFYSIDENAGTKQTKKFETAKFTYLDDPEVSNKLIQFTSNELSIVQFSLPQVHCSSCIWLIEKLYRIDKGILESKVDLNRKTVKIKFDNKLTSLRKVVEALCKVGYTPDLTLDKIESNEAKKTRRNRLIKLGVAGFCFGNIMMLSFPEYLSSSQNDSYLSDFPFRFLSFLFSLPVFFYSASEFYIPAYNGLKNRFINIDAPVFLAVLVTFLRSIYEILTSSSGGYFDSMTGIVFFMLLGRVFQDITYKYISFNRSVSSFIPIAISKKIKNTFEYVAVTRLINGDLILVRNEEIIPVDSVLLSETTEIDYSFVTGESEVKQFNKGDNIFAGGKIIGKAAQFMVKEKVDEGYLYSLWNNKKHSGQDEELYNQSYIHKVSSWFTLILFGIGILAFSYWSFYNTKTAFNALTTILIVACPCVLLLSHTYTYGFITNILTKSGIYLRNSLIIDESQKIEHIVFDKTGTLTHGNEKSIEWVGEPLSEEEKKLIRSTCIHSTHPKSKLIFNYTKDSETTETLWFEEFPGLGVVANIQNVIVKIGSAKFLEIALENENHNRTFVSINNHFKGYFDLHSTFHPDLKGVIEKFPEKTEFTILSGDTDADKEILQTIFPAKTSYIFNALPHEKLEYIKKLQANGKKVAMVGDGINDSGALQIADVGISIAGENGGFVPACDVYVEKQKFCSIPKYFALAKFSKKIVLANFGFALVYNSIGLAYAITGNLSPGIAAVLMPLSSITIICSTFLASYLYSKSIKINQL
jgi:Cu+-exporting ATPase